MKVGRPSLREDVERVRAMRAHLGPELPLMVDANMRWSVDDAIRAARALADFDLVWLEEPTIPDDVPGHVRIVREGGLPIAAGENLRPGGRSRRIARGTASSSTGRGSTAFARADTHSPNTQGGRP
jgi:L-alanine-DL-glutamate epimerase-like enolase superfamily enzyme